MFRPPALPEVQLQRVERDTKLAVGYVVYYGITAVSAGAFEFKYRRQIHTQDARVIKLKQPGELHRDLKVHAPVTGWSLGLAATAIEEAAAARGLVRFGLPEAVVPRSPRLGSLGERITRGERDPLALQEALATTIDALLGHADAPMRAADADDPPAARRARALICDAWHQPLSLIDLARAAGRDRFHTLRAFRRAYGMPPYRYLTHVRIAHARRLLAQGHAPADVALAVGLYDQSQLHRHFVRIVGVPPGRYARALQ